MLLFLYMHSRLPLCICCHVHCLEILYALHGLQLFLFATVVLLCFKCTNSNTLRYVTPFLLRTFISRHQYQDV